MKSALGSFLERSLDMASGLSSKLQAHSVISLKNKHDTRNPITWKFKEKSFSKIYVYMYMCYMMHLLWGVLMEIFRGKGDGM